MGKQGYWLIHHLKAVSLLVVIVICLYVVNGIFLIHTIPKQLEIDQKLLKILTLPFLARFCEVLNIFLDER